MAMGLLRTEPPSVFSPFNLTGDHQTRPNRCFYDARRAEPNEGSISGKTIHLHVLDHVLIPSEKRILRTLKRGIFTQPIKNYGVPRN